MADNNIIRHTDIAEDGVMKPLQEELIATIKILNTLDSELIKIATDLKKSLSNSNTATTDGIKKMSKEVEYSNEVLKASVKVKNDIIKTEAAMVVQVSSTTKELTENRLELERRNKLAKEDAKLVSDSSGAYEKLSITLAKAKREYKDLFILQKEGSVRGRELKQTIDQLEVSVRSADASVHQHQRNVGNYGHSFNGLSNSINQVTREFPAFVNSAQTGFMAISNNLPILIDNINQLKLKNAELNAEGKAGIPVWKQLVSGFFSWQTAIGIGITLMVAYGKELGAGIKSLFGFTDATEEQTRAQKELNDAYEEGVASLSDLNDYRTKEAEFNTRAAVINAKIAGKSVAEIAAIEKAGREKELKEAEYYAKQQQELFERISSSRYTFIQNSPNKQDDFTDDEKEALKALDANIKRQEDRATAARNKANDIQHRNALSARQAELDRKDAEDKAAEERRKQREKEEKERELARLRREKNAAKEADELAEELRKQTAEEEKEKYDIQIASEKAVHDETLRLMADVEDEMKEADKRKIEAEKMRQKVAKSGFDYIRNLMNKESQLRLEENSREISASQQRQDALRNIAEKGAQDAQNNLAFELRKQAELEAKRDKLIKKQIRQQQILAGLQAFASGNSKDLSAIKNIASFYEGTEDTGTVNTPLDENGGRLAVLHDNEAVMTKKLNEKRQKGGLDLESTVNYALAYKALINPTSFDRVPMSNHVNDDRLINETVALKSEVSELRKDLRSRPVQSLQVDEIERLINIKVSTYLKEVNTTRKIGGLHGY